MPWVRWGDGSATHPRVLAVLEWPDVDDRLLNEVFGFVARCATLASAHLTDYVVTRGTAMQMAGPSRAAELIAVCVATDLMSEVYGDGDTVVAYKLCDDDPEFLHLRLRKEVQWERQRRTDASNPSLTVPVRLRDGDGCRWCGRVVNWANDRRSARGGTYDHLDPGEQATIDTYVVACNSCNSSRKDGDLPEGVDQLLDPPDKPYFSPYSVKWLTENKWRIAQGLPVPSVPATIIIPGTRVDGSQPSRTHVDGSQPSRTSVGGSQPSRRPDRMGSPRSSAAIPTTGGAPAESQSSAAIPITGGAPAGGPEPTRVAPSAPSAPVGQSPGRPTADQTRVAPSAPSDRPGGVPGGEQSPPGSVGARAPDLGSADRVPKSVRFQSGSADRQGTEPVSTGRVGSGRAGTGRAPRLVRRERSGGRPRGGRRRGIPPNSER